MNQNTPEVYLLQEMRFPTSVWHSPEALLGIQGGGAQAHVEPDHGEPRPQRWWCVGDADVTNLVY
jgi:hypothetical protein